MHALNFYNKDELVYTLMVTQEEFDEIIKLTSNDPFLDPKGVLCYELTDVFLEPMA